MTQHLDALEHLLKNARKLYEQEQEESDSDDIMKIVKLKSGEWFFCSKVRVDEDGKLSLKINNGRRNIDNFLSDPSLDLDLQIYPVEEGAFMLTTVANVEYIICF